jgi:hypothetical protein
MPRIYPNEEGEMWYSDGDYGLDPRDGCWYGRPPGGHIGCLRNHEVTEHEDGTITVSPSILIIDREGSWHGYLEHGMWRTC